MKEYDIIEGKYVVCCAMNPMNTASSFFPYDLIFFLNENVIDLVYKLMFIF